MEKTQRIDLKTLINALEWCVINDDNCDGCPLRDCQNFCPDILRNSVTYLKILQEKCDEDNLDLRRKVAERDKVKTIMTEAAILPFKPAPAPIPQKADQLPAHWIWVDDGVINPDNVMYLQLEGQRTKIRMVDAKTYLDGDPFGIAQRTGSRSPKAQDLEDD